VATISLGVDTEGIFLFMVKAEVIGEELIPRVLERVGVVIWMK
jgi:hypothetical protein